MFGIRTARDFLDKLEADYSDFTNAPNSARFALNCSITAYHLHEWVWGDWLKNDQAVRNVLGIQSRKDFLEWIDRACPRFRTIQDLTNGTKHFARPQHLEGVRVARMPFMFGVANAGFGQGTWGGPEPYVAGEDSYLLIDYGPAAAEHRWLPAAMVLDVVVRFWRQFFAEYAPSEQRDGIIDWRLKL